jgi:hypothetical protein
MKRLLDETEAQDETTMHLAALLASAEPPAHDAFRKRRIRVAVDARVQSARPRRRPLRAVLLVATLVGTAAAMSGLLLAPEPPTPATDATPAPPPQATERKPTSPTEAIAPTPPDANVEVVAKAPEPHPPAKPRSTARSAKPNTAEGEDPTQVVEAVRALRKEKDPKRAQALLDGYLNKNPDGALSEEALALSMEAAASSKSPKAVDYARRYLERFPQGRHAAFARRLVAR